MKILQPKHPDFFFEPKFKRKFLNKILRKKIYLDQINLQTHDFLEVKYRLTIYNKFFYSTVIIDTNDLQEITQKLLSAYYAFYYEKGSITTLELAFDRQRWSCNIPLELVDEVLWTLCQQCIKDGLNLDIDTKFLFKKDQSAYR